MRARWPRSAKRLTARFGRRAVALLMLACYAVALLGVPVVDQAPHGVSIQAYPCQHGTCGCRSAAQCWRSCCCYTDPQKLAWAEQHGVRPPAEFLERMALASVTQRPGQTAGCCAASQPPVDRPANGACCRPSSPTKSTANAARRAGGAEADEPSQPRLRVAIMLEVLKCRGLETDWTGLPNVVLPVRQQVAPLDAPWARLAPAAAAQQPQPSYPPPSPPPRDRLPLQ